MYSSAVVILNYNGEDHLRRFLPSVVENTPERVDIIVADNGSTDNSLEIIRGNFPRVRTILLDKNYGFAGGYNRALRELKHDYFILLNSDVEVTNGWSEPLLEELHQNSDVGAVAPKLRSLCEPSKFEYAGAAGGYIDALGYPFCRGRIMQCTEEDRGQYDDKRDLFWVSGAAFGCRAELFHSLGGFDSDMFAHMEEIDLCWRMQLRGYKVRIIPTSVVYHLGGGTLQKSSPQKIYLNHRNNLVMLFKCAPTAMRITVALVRPPLDMAAALSYFIKGDLKGAYAVLRAYGTFIKWHPRLLQKRREVRSTRIAESQYIYRGSIIVRYLLGSRKFDTLL